MPKRRSAPCFPIQTFPVVVSNFPAQPIACQPAFDDHVIGATFPLGRQRETETALIVLDLRDRLDREYRKGDVDSREVYKAEFYQALLNGASNAILTEALRSIHARIAIFRRFAFVDEARVEPSIRELETIIDAAAKARDPKAAQAACEHHILVAGDLAVFEYTRRNRDLKTAS